MTKIIVYVDGGLVQAVYSTDPDIDVTLYDKDNIDSGDSPPFTNQDLKILTTQATPNCVAKTKMGDFYEIF